MVFEVMFSFDGNAKQAADFYAGVFGTKVEKIIKFSDAPAHPDFPMNPKDKDKVCYVGVPMGGGLVLMMSDMPSDVKEMPGYKKGLVVGNNVSPTLSFDTVEETQKVYAKLAEGGEQLMPLGKTFFSESYGTVKDKFGIIWSITKLVENK
ncbi:MAG: VOC family protein [Firmicutes bacterium]|nr:VOC family protein [Bacillota bacterium]